MNTLTPQQNGRRFTGGILKCIFFHENACSLIKISLMFVPEAPAIRNTIKLTSQFTTKREERALFLGCTV